jgi:hypothetical protein
LTVQMVSNLTEPSFVVADRFRSPGERKNKKLTLYFFLPTKGIEPLSSNFSTHF